MTAVIYSFRCSSFHHVNTKRRFDFPLVTVSIIYVCRQPCNLLPRRPSAAADPSVDHGATTVCLAPHRGHSARTCTRAHARKHTHTTQVNTSPVPVGDFMILFPAWNSELSCLDYLHENSEKHHSDADFQRQLSQVLPAVGGSRVHDSGMNPTKDSQETASVQELFLSGDPAEQSGRLKTPGLPNHAERALP